MEICITDLEEYNNGKLRCEWVDIENMDIDDLNDKILDFLGDHEEWFISDYEDFPDYLGEYTTVEEIMETAEYVREYGHEVVSAFLDMGRILDEIEDSYDGTWESEEDFTENLLDSCGMFSEIPEWAVYYFDLEAYTKDLFMTDYTSVRTSDYQYMVFRN